MESVYRAAYQELRRPCPLEKKRLAGAVQAAVCILLEITDYILADDKEKVNKSAAFSGQLFAGKGQSGSIL